MRWPHFLAYAVDYDKCFVANLSQGPPVSEFENRSTFVKVMNQCTVACFRLIVYRWTMLLPDVNSSRCRHTN